MSDVQFTVTADVSQATSAMQTLSQSMGNVQNAVNNANSRLAGFGAKMTQIGNKVSGIGKTMAVAVSLPLALIGKQMLETGSNMKAFHSAYAQSFGEMASKADEWASQTAKAVGLTDNQVKQSILGFNKYSKAMGMGGEQALEYSKKMAMLTMDLAAFSDVPVDEAMDRMKSGLMGNYEALDALGLSFGEATIKAEMLSEGYKGQFSDLDEVTKMQILYNLAMKQGADAVGQASKESDSYQTKMQKLKGTMNDLYEKVFLVVEPVITKIVDGLTQMVEKFSNLSPATMGFITAIGGLLIILPPILIVVGSLISAVGTISTAIAGLGGVMAILTSPVTIVIAVITALIAIFVLAYKHSEAFRNQVDSAWNSIKEIISSAVADIKVILSVVMAFLTELWKKHGNEIMNIVSTAFSVISNVIKGALNIISGVIKVFAGLLTGDWKKVWEGIKQIVDGVFNGIIKGIDSAISLVQNIIKSGLNIALSVVKGIADGIKNALVNAFKFQIPHIPLPHFNIKGSFSLNPPSIPSIGVNWYANGGIVNSPQLIGVGEAGAEAIVPLSSAKRLKPFGEAVANFLPDSAPATDNSNEIVNNFYLSDVKMDSKQDITKLAEELYKLQERNRRASGNQRTPAPAF